jgi:MFS family permease
MNPDLTMSKTALILPLSAVGLGVSNVLSIKLAEKIGFKNLCGLFILLFGFCLFTMTLISNFWLGVFFASFLGVSYGMVNSPTQVVCWGWYEKRKGMVVGILLSSHGFIGMLINFLITKWMNPNNE